MEKNYFNAESALYRFKADVLSGHLDTIEPPLWITKCRNFVISTSFEAALSALKQRFTAEGKKKPRRTGAEK